jgi:hypothetical protein
VRNPNSTEALPEVAELFLYTNSPGQLNYTLAFFRIAVRIQEGPQPGPEKAAIAQLNEANFKSNRGKRGETWQPLTKK